MEIFDNGIPVFAESDDRTLNQILEGLREKTT